MHDGARFIWRGEDITRYGDLGGALCSLKTSEDAADFWNAYVEFLSRATAILGGKSPTEVAASNIGYLMGYYDSESRKHVYSLFPNVSHPIFGRMESEPTPAQALEAGKRAAYGEFSTESEA